MTYSQFRKCCHTGAIVTDRERLGQIIKISQDKEKALVRFSDGMTEWIEYYRIEFA